MAKRTSSKTTKAKTLTQKPISKKVQKAPPKKSLALKKIAKKSKPASKKQLIKVKSAVKPQPKSQKAQKPLKAAAPKAIPARVKKSITKAAAPNAKPSTQMQLARASHPAHSHHPAPQKTHHPLSHRKAQYQHVTLSACSRFMQDLRGTLESYMRLVQSIAPGAKLPQQPAWYLRQGQLETLEPVLASLEASVKSPKIAGDDIHTWKETLPNLGRMIGAAAQVIPHVYQTQALHILLHLGEHPRLPDNLVTPLAEALYTIASQPKNDHLEERHIDRAHRILKGLTPTPFPPESKKGKAPAQPTNSASQRPTQAKSSSKKALAHARN